VPRTFRPRSRAIARPFRSSISNNWARSSPRKSNRRRLARVERLLEVLFQPDALRLIGDDDPTRGKQALDSRRAGPRPDRFVPDGRRNEHLPVQAIQELELPDTGQVKKWRGIRDDDHGPPASSRRESSKS
jgi:hypothetical protein